MILLFLFKMNIFLTKVAKIIALKFLLINYKNTFILIGSLDLKKYIIGLLYHEKIMQHKKSIKQILIKI